MRFFFFTGATEKFIFSCFFSATLEQANSLMWKINGFPIGSDLPKVATLHIYASWPEGKYSR